MEGFDKPISIVPGVVARTVTFEALASTILPRETAAATPLSFHAGKGVGTRCSRSRETLGDARHNRILTNPATKMLNGVA